MKPWVWRAWLILLLSALVLLLAVQALRAMPLTPGVDRTCESGLVTRHDAFYSSVLQVFPERAVAGVHGYVGVADCSLMGRRGELWLQGHRFEVSVADCLNRAHTTAHDALWGDTWLADVDRKLWIEAGAPGKPTEAMICWE